MTYQQAAQNALDIQNACNAGGVVYTFAEVIQAVWTESHRRTKEGITPSGTDWVNRHPITMLFIDKLNDLAGRVSFDDYVLATELCQFIANGQEVPINAPR